MGAYLDRLNQQYAEIKQGIDTLVDRAADANRDVTPEEQAQVDRDQARMTELEKAIEHYSAIDASAAKVGDLRNRSGVLPTTRTTNTQVKEPEYDVAREFPTPGHYAQTVHQAQVFRDAEAIARLTKLVEHLDRDTVTKHQTTADNPGIIPRPILGPVINDIDNARPFIASIATRPLPAGQFDRPVITQHVAIGQQAVEKDRTESQKMLIGKLPVTATTFAGHVNLSRQDVKWSNPQILTILYQDFSDVYAQETDADAGADFFASVTNLHPIPEDDWGGPDLYEHIYEAAAAGLVPGKSNQLPDTLWVAPDIWGMLGSMLTPMGAPMFPSLSPGSTTGNALNLKLVVDANFPLGDFVLGQARYAEWYEDIDGLMQVGEPDVNGQLVGYAGYGAFLNTKPAVFTKFRVTPAAPPLDAAAAKSSK